MDFKFHEWIGSEKNKRIFISYAHNDFGPYASRFASDLRKNNISIWLDKIDLRPSIEWEEEIERGIEECDKVVFIMSERAVADKGYCRKEIAYAQQFDKPIIPIKIEEVEPLISICTIQQIEMLEAFKDGKINEDEYKIGFDALINCINDKEIDSNSGYHRLYKGLKPIPQNMYFDHNAKSYGYDRIRQELDDWIKNNKGDLALIIADSGSGKSTFIANYADNNSLILGINFCKYNNHDRCNTKRILMTLAYELANYIPDYALRLQRKSFNNIEEKDSSAIFDYLFVEPLSNISKKPDRIYFVIDGISNITNEQDLDYFPKFLAYEMIPAKLGIKFIITSDKDINKVYNPIIRVDVFKQTKEEVDEAIKLYLEDTLKDYLNDNSNNKLVEKIIEKAEHNFFYAKNVVSEIKDEKRDINYVIDNLPKGIKNMYSEFFKRTFNENKYLSYDDAKKVLMILLVQKQVLSISSIINVLGSNEIKSPEEIVNKTFVLLNNYIKINRLNAQEQNDINIDAEGSNIKNQFSSLTVEITHTSLRSWLLEGDSFDPFHIILGDAHYLFINHYEESIEEDSLTTYTCRYFITHLIENEEKKNLKRATELLCDTNFAKNREKILGENEAFKIYFNEVYELGLKRDKSGVNLKQIFKSEIFKNYLVGYRKYLYNQKDAYKKLKKIGFTEFVKEYTETIDNDTDYSYVVAMVDYLYICEEFKEACDLIGRVNRAGKERIAKLPDDLEVEFKKMACLSFRKFGKIESSIKYSGLCEELNKANDGAFNYDLGVVDLIVGKIHYHKLEFDAAEKTINKGIELLLSTLKEDNDNNEPDDFDDFDDFGDFDDKSKETKSKYVVDKYISSQNYPRFIINYVAAFKREIALLHLWNNNPDSALKALNEIKETYDDKEYIYDRYYSRYLFARMFYNIYTLNANVVIKDFQVILPYASNDYVKGQMLFFMSLANYVLNLKDDAINYINEAISVTEKNKEIYERCEMELVKRLLENDSYNPSLDEIKSIIDFTNRDFKYTDKDKSILENWIKYVFNYIINLKKKYDNR